MKFLKAIFSLSIFGIFAIAATTPNQDAFKKYWYAGKAELDRYSLDQARYGEMHKGEAVLIFVTEPFFLDKQVKYEHGDKSNAVTVMKVNFTKRFFTGIYPYTLITSTFSPVDFQKYRTLKVASSSQEWCGQTYTQLNLKQDQYQAQVHSYFQDEADENVTVKPAWLEDEVWTRIRLAPDTLPSGDVEMLPGLQYIRLLHQEVKPQKAAISSSEQGKLRIYTIEYKEQQRKLTIRFEKDFPHQIESWEETAPGGFGPNAPILTTKASRTNTLLLDYWNKHGEEDAAYRTKLGLTQR